MSKNAATPAAGAAAFVTHPKDTLRTVTHPEASPRKFPRAFFPRRGKNACGDFPGMPCWEKRGLKARALCVGRAEFVDAEQGAG